MILVVGGTGDLGRADAFQEIHLGPLAQFDVTGRRMKVKHMPRPVARVVIRLLDKRNDALASALGAGLLQDLLPADWDDAPLREHGIETTSAAGDFLRGSISR